MALPNGERIRGPALDAGRWLLTAQARDNAHTALDRRHPDGLAWSVGNDVRPLVHGAAYFRGLLSAVQVMGAGDRLMFTDWRGDEDELLDGPGTEVGKVFADAALRGVEVRGLIWRSHMKRFKASADVPSTAPRLPVRPAR